MHNRLATWCKLDDSAHGAVGDCETWRLGKHGAVGGDIGIIGEGGGEGSGAVAKGEVQAGGDLCGGCGLGKGGGEDRLASFVMGSDKALERAEVGFGHCERGFDGMDCV